MSDNKSSIEVGVPLDGPALSRALVSNAESFSAGGQITKLTGSGPPQQPPTTTRRIR